MNDEPQLRPKRDSLSENCLNEPFLERITPCEVRIAQCMVTESPLRLKIFSKPRGLPVQRT
jgi:hypothetical protein